MGNSLEEKKELVIRALPLGMALEDAMFLAEMTEDEIEACDGDERFQMRTRRTLLREQEKLLDMFDGAMRSNVREGKTADVIWKLGLLDAKRYGNAAQRASAGDLGSGITLNIRISKDKASLEQENVEVNEADAAIVAEKADTLGIEDGSAESKKG